MKVYIKSAGRKDTQDYVWVCFSGEEDPSDLNLISKAERSVPNQGIVHALSAPENGRVALFLGNVRSDRTDFCGTPILNRLAVVYSENDHARRNVVQTLVSEWRSGTSELIPLLRDGIVRSDNPRGFDWTPDFSVGLKRIIGNAGDRVIKGNPAARDGGDTSFQPAITEKSKMKISINTVPSASDDYDWYFGERPDYAGDIWNICERVRASIASKCFFAALHKQPGAWCLFLQDIIGRDRHSNRPARGTISIEIPDDSPQAEGKARNLLAAWLTPNSPLLAIFKNNVDVSSETVVVKGGDLYDGVEKLTAGETLYDGSLPSRRLLYRVSEDLSNINELRTYASRFVRRYKFGDQPGVHFLFTLCPYSAIPGDIDMLPDMPAKFIVLGWRAGEPGDTPNPAIVDPPRPAPENKPAAAPAGRSPLVADRSAKEYRNEPRVTVIPRSNNNFWFAVGTAALVLLLVFFAFCRGCKTPPPDDKTAVVKRKAADPDPNTVKKPVTSRPGALSPSPGAAPVAGQGNDAAEPATGTVEKPARDSAADDPSAKPAPRDPGAQSPDAASSVPATRKNQPSRQ